ncbi:VOC family protein [Pectobacteriaceae bacterium CE90]|nr:VOC family protein [Pectobacteriaceae bacterium CE90]
MIATLRIARPVTDLQKSLSMYSRGLALQKLAEFADHAGISGVMLGRENLPWHLEFTFCHTHPIIPSPTVDDLLVLYIPEQDQWALACQRMEQAGFSTVKSFNPYWDQQGKTFCDHDGYRVVLQNSSWPVVR